MPSFSFRNIGINLKTATAFLLLCAFTICSQVSIAQDRTASLKAAYVYYFTKFVYWPEEKSSRMVCVDSSSQQLQDAFAKISIKASNTLGLTFLTESVTHAELALCDLVYLTESSATSAKDLGLAKGSLLVVDDGVEGSVAVITLMVVDSKLVFEINRNNARQSQLEISAKLLGLARKVYDGAS